jgi:hypothetical protein
VIPYTASLKEPNCASGQANQATRWKSISGACA